MRFFSVALFCLVGLTQGYGQAPARTYGGVVVEITKAKKPRKISTRVKLTQPAFPGGDSAWARSLEALLDGSIPFRNGAKAGKYTVSVRFLIERDGNIADIRCITDPGFGMCRQVMDALRRKFPPRWGPAPDSSRKAREYHRSSISPQEGRRIFDVHLHGSEDPSAQMMALERAGVYGAAISTSWDLQNRYRNTGVGTRLLYGLMFPCPNGKVPYSLQPCYGTGKDWPAVEWVEEQIRGGKIDYLGEVLHQYYGIAPADSLLFPYYRLALKYKLPVGIHTGGAGPDHGSPNFKMEMGRPSLLQPLLSRFPGLRVWIMHSGVQDYKETIAVMEEHKTVYADISLISNPDIVPGALFSTIVKAFIDAGLEDRIMFGTDNGDIQKVIASVESLPFLSETQKKKLYYLNAEQFFRN